MAARKRKRGKRKPSKARKPAPKAAAKKRKAAKREKPKPKRVRGSRQLIEDLRHAMRRIPQVLVCEILNSQRKLLRDWTEKGAPRNEDGTYDLGSIVAWRLDQLAGIEKAEVTSPALERMRLARAEMAEMDRAERVGDLVSTDEVQRGRLERVAAVTRMMDSMSRRLPPLLVSLDAPGIQAMIEDECRRIRDEFAREPEPAGQQGAGQVA